MGSRNLRSQQYVMAAVLTAIYGTPSFADTAGDASNADINVLQEVTVTATRHAVSAEDLPISITAVSGDHLDSAGIEDMGALTRSMAGVSSPTRAPSAPLRDRA